MGKKRFFTFIIAHSAEVRLKKISISHAFVYRLVSVGLIVFLAGMLAISRYTNFALADYNKLREENKQIKFENQNYKLLTHQINEKISSLEVVSKKLAVMSGLEPTKSKAGATGSSPTKERPSSAVVPPALPLDQMNRHVEVLANLEERFRKLNEYYNDQFIVKSYTPSIWPVKGFMSRGFGRGVDPLMGEGAHHTGIDISAPYGGKVLASASGVVTFSGYRADYGNLVIIKHKFGISTFYAHLLRSAVKVGQRVDRHDLIGFVGSTGRSTGPHLHYEVRINNRPVNPYRFLNEDRAMNQAAEASPKQRG